ncbi:hypothetical protein HMPREF0868_1648 [Mageeibacillus indolicus UPII9-5]|uniref:Uncharacterized protein n=1 Tax=Mageeibacillus indolicus (strain UPII9-5) TaxID=699246 RepID=E1PK54_MAGIU|nr:hypothetical protein HMPREF0868_1648 [Mageeibacillus indolicus UPII9-5]
MSKITTFFYFPRFFLEICDFFKTFSQVIYTFYPFANHFTA